jgi:ATP-binding cassette subfamily C protein
MTRASLSLLLTIARRRQLALIVALAVLGALTEGIGFVLLVPLVALVIGGSGEVGVLSPVSRWIEAQDWQPSLGVLLACFALLVLLRAVADYVRVMASMRLSMRIVDGLRERAFAALLAADWRTLSRMRQSENRAMLISEIDRTAIAIDQLGGLVRIGIGLVAIGLAALAISPWVALAGAAAGALVFALYGGLRQRARSLGEDLSAQYRSVHGLLEENLDALRSIKSFGMEEMARARMAEGFRALRQVRVNYTTDTLLARSLLQVGGALLAASAVWLALERWQVPAIVILPLVALYARALPQFGALLDCWQLWAHASPAVVAADRLIRSAEADAEQQPGQSADMPRLMRSIALENVSFAHREGVQTLTHVSFSIAAGDTVALVGPSGAGKSTLADILGGLVAPDGGQVLLDGVPLNPTMRQGWRRQVAYVDQHPVLFDGSVRDNLCWADPQASEARLREALDLAAAQFVHQLPGGLDCPLGERGRQLSGGERQRIVLARALLRDPALLILDEATSALDSVADEAIASAIDKLAGKRTVLIIGHRGALTQIAARVITLDAGRIAADVRRS